MKTNVNLTVLTCIIAFCATTDVGSNAETC
jgi:hypothetical protein